MEILEVQYYKEIMLSLQPVLFSINGSEHIPVPFLFWVRAKGDGEMGGEGWGVTLSLTSKTQLPSVSSPSPSSSC